MASEQLTVTGPATRYEMLDLGRAADDAGLDSVRVGRDDGRPTGGSSHSDCCESLPLSTHQNPVSARETPENAMQLRQ